MKFIIQKGLLEEKLQQALRFTSTKITSIQALQGCVLKTKEKGLEITTTNLNDFYISSIPADIKEQGESLIDLKKLLEFLSLAGEGELSISLEDNLIKVEHGKTTAFFNTYPKEDYPEIPKTRGEQTILKKNELTVMQKVLFSASKDETRPVLTGVLFSFVQGVQNYVTTDGFRLSLSSFKTNKGIVKTLVPSSVLLEVLKMAKNEDVVFEYSEDEKVIKFSFGDITLFSRVLEGDFPPYEKVIPKNRTTEIIVDKKEMVQGVKMVSIFAREQADVVVCEISKKGILMRPKQQTKKTPEVFVDIKGFEGEDIKIAFNYRYVLDFLNNIQSDEAVIRLNQSTAPGVFMEKGNEDFIHIIMPLRTEETATEK